MLGCLLAFMATTLALAAAHVENQFFLPPFVRSPAYDFVYQQAPLNVSDVPSSQVISLRFGDVPLTCTLPNPSETVNETILHPLTDMSIIEKGREAISEFGPLSLITIDDVWVWLINFNSSVTQCLPRRDDGELTLLPNSFRVVVGVPGPGEGQNLQTAQPVVVHDKHMLMATFSNGSFCDLTREGRQTRIFFTCDPNASSLTLLNVDEPYSCLYEMLFGTDKLCSIPEFAETQLATNKIRCGPNPDTATPDEITTFGLWVDDMEAAMKKMSDFSSETESESEEPHLYEIIPDESDGFFMNPFAYGRPTSEQVSAQTHSASQTRALETRASEIRASETRALETQLPQQQTHGASGTEPPQPQAHPTAPSAGRREDARGSDARAAAAESRRAIAERFGRLTEIEHHYTDGSIERLNYRDEIANMHDHLVYELDGLVWRFRQDLQQDASELFANSTALRTSLVESLRDFQRHAGARILPHLESILPPLYDELEGPSEEQGDIATRMLALACLPMSEGDEDEWFVTALDSEGFKGKNYTQDLLYLSAKGSSNSGPRQSIDELLRGMIARKREGLLPDIEIPETDEQIFSELQAIINGLGSFSDPEVRSLVMMKLDGYGRGHKTDSTGAGTPRVETESPDSQPEERSKYEKILQRAPPGHFDL